MATARAQLPLFAIVLLLACTRGRVRAEARSCEFGRFVSSLSACQVKGGNTTTTAQLICVLERVRLFAEDVLSRNFDDIAW